MFLMSRRSFQLFLHYDTLKGNMYSLKAILLLNCVRQGDLNSKSVSLNFFKVPQCLCSSLPSSILPSPIFPPSSKVYQFHLSNWKGYLSKISAGKHKIIKVYAPLIFCHIDFFPKPFIWFFFQRSLLILKEVILQFVRILKNDWGTKE